MKILLNNRSLIETLRPFNDLGFVPTMGGIHEGHLSLINKSNKLCKKTIVSIFVNPKQFNNKKDLISYPRNIKKDLQILKKCKKVDLVVVAIPKSPANDSLKVYLENKNYNIFEGEENDVLSRFYHAAKKFNITKIIRLTADCPFHDPALIDNAIDLFNKKNLDFLCNYNPPTFPDGYDLSISTFEQLKDAFKNAKTPYDKEHVVPYLIRKKKIKKMNIESDGNFSNLRLTIDEKKDYEFLIKIFKYFKTKKNFNYADVKKTYKKNKSIFNINSNIIRDEGSELSKEQKIWKRAKQIIPGGNMLFSKRPERFLPGFWPTYFNKAKGVNIWTLSGKKYIDMSLMGVGTNILGYSNSKINTQVLSAIKKGNISKAAAGDSIGSLIS